MYQPPQKVRQIDNGEGKFSQVWEGKDSTYTRMAIKVLIPNEFQDEWEERCNNLIQEGTRLREAEHDNVVRLYYIIESPEPVPEGEPKELWLITEYCEGGSVGSIYNQRPLTLRECKTLLTQVTRGLHALHSRNIIHRDIKPNNILIGQRGVYKLADFGLATIIEDLGAEMGVGYRPHWAPEVFTDGVSNPKTDIWALGFTAYRLLHGDIFYRENVHKYLSKPAICHPNFSKSLPWLPHVPKEWRRVISKMMHCNPDKRTSNALDVEGLIAGLPVDFVTNCDYSGTATDGKVTWLIEKPSKRPIEVEWSWDTNGHLWSADRKGLRSAHIAGVVNLVGEREAIEGLENFFEKV